MLRVLAVIAAFALLVYALADFANSDERDRGGIPGWLWVVIIILLPYFGPLSWIVFSRSRRRQVAGPGFPSSGPAPRGRRRPSGPLAPDDDPEFLWRLAREQRHQTRPAGSDTDTADGLPDDPTLPEQSHPGQTHPGPTQDDQGPDATKP